MLTLHLTVLVLLPSAVPSGGIVYKKLEAKRADTALLDTEAGSRLQCALRCLEESCTHWTFDLPTRRCRLYPLPRSDTAPGVTETVYTVFQPPDGFRVFEGTTKAFGKFNEEMILGYDWVDKPDLICPHMGRRALPAVPETEQEFLILRDFAGDDRYWVGFTRTRGVYHNLYGRELQLNETWLAGIPTDDEINKDGPQCFDIRSDGLNKRGCGKITYGMCQYTP